MLILGIDPGTATTGFGLIMETNAVAICHIRRTVVECNQTQVKRG